MGSVKVSPNELKASEPGHLRNCRKTRFNQEPLGEAPSRVQHGSKREQLLPSERAEKQRALAIAQQQLRQYRE